MCRTPHRVLLVASALLSLASAAFARPPAGTLEAIRARGVLLWGADAEGGAPYVFPDPKDPGKLIGFEVDLAEAIARELGVTQKISQGAWDSLLPALNRGDFDVAMNGIEITPLRAEKILFSVPYYVYTEQLVVRKEETRIRDLSDLRGKKVGTLTGAVAQEILEGIGGVRVRTYSGQVEPYEDLALGRLDAVLMDLPIAAYYAKPNPKLRYQGPPSGEGFYGIALRKGDAELKAEIDRILARLLQRGELRRIYEKWDLWNEAQGKLSREAGGGGPAAVQEAKEAPLSTFFPSLFLGAGITVLLSVSSMSLAICLGLALAVLKIYGRRPFSTLASGYIEVYRGTPLLIQLYLLYFGLPNLGISLSPFTAAVLGLGMNYAAYEAEIYRAGIGAIPGGQTEAALSLGMRPPLAFRRIVFPQALRISLPGITNDFVALFKDSSLVSVIAMVELTKTYTIHAATTLRYFELGLVVAFLYFAMSWPLARVARKLEERLKGDRP